MIDFTSLAKKFNPDQDGEPHTHLRVGTVTTVNSNGTLDITMSGGIVVPGVPRLNSAHAPLGASVQMIGFRGSLLVIGAVSVIGGTPVQVSQSGAQNVSTSGSASTLSVAVAFPETYPIGTVPKIFLNHKDGSSDAQLWILKATTVTNTGFNILGSRSTANTLTNSPVDWIALT